MGGAVSAVCGRWIWGRKRRWPVGFSGRRGGGGGQQGMVSVRTPPPPSSRAVKDDGPEDGGSVGEEGFWAEGEPNASPPSVSYLESPS